MYLADILSYEHFDLEIGAFYTYNAYYRFLRET